MKNPKKKPTQTKKTAKNPVAKTTGKTKRKWNRKHYFKQQPTNKKGEGGHPVYVYGKSGQTEKFLMFTHTPLKGNEDLFEQLKHNIDPEDLEDCYVKKKPDTSKNLSEPKKKYRIHKDDWETVKKYKK